MYVKRYLSERLVAFKGTCFPYKTKRKTSFRHTATVGIGGNLGDVKRRFQHLFFYLQREHRVSVLETALILKNPPFGYFDQDDFFNSIIVVKTDMNAEAFLAYLMRLEKKFGRKRSFANAPRTLDLDMIFFDNLVMKTKNLTLPHPAWSQRESVVIPLASMSR